MTDEQDSQDVEASEDVEETPAEDENGEKVDDTPVPEEGDGEKGLGSESGALGGEESPPHNPDPATKGATKGTEGAL